MSHLQKDRDRNWRILRNGHYHEWLELMKLLTDVACFFPCRIIKAKKYEGVSNCIIPYCQNEKRLDAGNIYIYIYSSWNLFPCLITGKLTLTLYHLQTGRKPSGLCGTALYISALSHGYSFSKTDIVSPTYLLLLL